MSGYNDIHGCVPVMVPPIQEGLEGEVILLRNGITGLIKAKFELWLLTNAEMAKEQMKKVKTPAEYADICQNHQAAIASGTYLWLGDAMLKALQQIPGIVHMSWLLANDAAMENGEARNLKDAKGMPQGLHFDVDDIYFAIMRGAEFAKAIESVQRSSQANFMLPPTMGERMAA